MGKKSAVWNYYKQNKETQRVCCKICLQTFNYHQSGNLKRHLVRVHGLQWQLASSRTISDDLITKTIKNKDDDDETSSEATSIPQEQKVQSVLQSDTEYEGDVRPVEEWLEEADINSLSSYHITKKKSRKRAKLKQTDNHSNDIKVFKSSDQENQFKDVYDAFGTYVASKIRDINDTKTKVNVQQLISKILWQAEYGIYSNFEAVNKIIMTPMEPTLVNKVPQANIVIPYANQQNGTELQTEQNTLSGAGEQ